MQANQLHHFIRQTKLLLLHHSDSEGKSVDARRPLGETQQQQQHQPVPLNSVGVVDGEIEEVVKLIETINQKLLHSAAGKRSAYSFDGREEDEESPASAFVQVGRDE